MRAAWVVVVAVLLLLLLPRLEEALRSTQLVMSSTEMEATRRRASPRKP